MYYIHLKLLCEMRQVRDFQPVLHADTWGENTARFLREAVVADRENGLLDGSFLDPLVTHIPHWSLQCGVFP